MKTLFIACSFLVCTLAQAQEKKGFFSIALGLNFPTVPNSDPIIGGHISANGQLGKGAFVGMELGFVKFQGMEGLYIPVQAKFTMIPGRDPKKVSPMVILSPGYGVYNKTISGVTTQGGFVFYGGVGAKFPGKGNSGGFITVGYSLFGFNIYEEPANVESIGIRAGIML